MLLNCCTHQPRHAIDIQTVKMRLRRSANSARAMDHGVNAAYQTTQAVRVFERTFDPMNMTPGQTASI
jgi:hypothetical protein